MNARTYMIGLVGALAFGTVAATVQAAPAGGVAASAQAAGKAASAVETVAYRRCVRPDGSRHCRWRSHNSYYSYYREVARSVPRVILGIAF